VQGQADLLEVVDALRPPGRLACGLDRRQQQRDQDGDDGDDHQQLDQGEAGALTPAHGNSSGSAAGGPEGGRDIRHPGLSKLVFL